MSDTITLLVDERIPTSGAPLRELYEVANHRETVVRIAAHAFSSDRLTGPFIRQVQADLLDHIHDDRGHWKATRNAILGATVETAEPGAVPHLMEQWAENARWQAENLTGSAAIAAIADAHAEFERVHPFPDVNGRTGRLLTMWQTMRAFGLPVVIAVDQRERYLAALHDDDRIALTDLLAECLLFEADRAEKFGVHR